MLALLIDLAAASLQENRPLFPNPLVEPVLYRKFARWVRDGLAEAARIKKVMAEAAKSS